MAEYFERKKSASKFFKQEDAANRGKGSFFRQRSEQVEIIGLADRVQEIDDYVAAFIS